MIRFLLPAIFVATPLAAEDIGVCENVPFSQSNCTRVLACIGDEGITFDGRARGWDSGTVTGAMSDGVICRGTWRADGPFGLGLSNVICDDGTTIDVLYHSQDDITGTAIGSGKDSRGRAIKVWSGGNILQFLTPSGAFGPALPCVQGDIPIS